MYIGSSSSNSEGSPHSRTSSFINGIGIPSYLRKVIRRTSDDGTEMQFPLSGLSELQRQGMGMGDAEKVLVRLTSGSNYNSPRYCVHLSDEHDFDHIAHTPWLLARHRHAPDVPYCRGIPSLAVYQLSRILWWHLKEGFVLLKHTYFSISASITELSTMCVICGRRHSTHLRRSTICGNPECSALFAAASFEIHMGDIWSNHRVVDLLLTAAHAAALTTAWSAAPRLSRVPVSLLKDCPVSDATTLANMLNRLPAIHDLAERLAHDLETPEAKSLRPNLLAKALKWACTSHGRLLTQAVDQYRIPGFHGIPQFLLANASPMLERRFAVQLKAANGNTFVMFHGTSLDRLHSILHNGLRICTDTPLMVHQATSGPGVYMTTEPEVAAKFATPMHELPALAHLQSSNNPKLHYALSGRRNSAFRNQGVLLACEVAWPRHANGTWADMHGWRHIWCVKGPANIMVRYVFLVESGTPVPKARDVEKYFGRAFAKLRLGVW